MLPLIGTLRMKIPKGMTEAHVLETIEKVASFLAPKFRFGYNEISDMKQYATIFAIEGLEKYNPKLGTLETFLWTHVRNRLFNLKRDNYERPDNPCSNCTLQCDKANCEIYQKWYLRNAKKRNIINPIELGNVHDENENNMKVMPDIEGLLDYKEMINVIDRDIPINLRTLWVKLQNGFTLNKSDKEKIIPVIRDILKRNNIDDPQAW